VIADALALGATLYLPATRPDLGRLLLSGRIDDLRSAVVCLEDAVGAGDVPVALDRLAAFLRELGRAVAPAIFVRPRDAAMLDRIVRMPGAEHLAGFALPKISAATLPRYAAVAFGRNHRIMPIIETREAFDQYDMRHLRSQLLALGDRVLALRIGGNDLLQALGARRARSRTIYDGPLGPLVSRLVGDFAPWGFALTGPVMELYDDPPLLREEVLRDLEHGLVGKTAIHPSQVSVIHGAMAVPPDELAAAKAVMSEQAPAVFALGGSMMEPATHRRWAAATLRRAELFGVADQLCTARRFEMDQH
jgi:citrate lyase beta subunit